MGDRARGAATRRAGGVAALALACATAAALSAFLAAPEALTWTLELPRDRDAGFDAALRVGKMAGGGRGLSWTVGEPGRLAFLAFHAPGGEGLALGAGTGGLYRFSGHPLVRLGADGIYRLEAERFLMAWRLDDATIK
jgi:hypothetical protein